MEKKKKVESKTYKTLNIGIQLMLNTWNDLKIKNKKIQYN